LAQIADRLAILVRHRHFDHHRARIRLHRTRARSGRALGRGGGRVARSLSRLPPCRASLRESRDAHGNDRCRDEFAAKMSSPGMDVPDWLPRIGRTAWPICPSNIAV
jgi:hypothetical protein